jgi:hypothetical protein
MFLPSANEALAEAALLQECTRRPAAFSNPSAVYSYPLNSEGSRTGVFRHYMAGLCERHEHIARACDESRNGVVQYVDIKSFYPSISPGLASKAWLRQCEIGSLPKRLRTLGEKLIADHARASGNDTGGILTGPMFSHLLANLVLREIDNLSSARLPVKYFRYVDDITLVGDSASVKLALGILRTQLSDLGFELHEDSSPKSIAVSTTDWLKGRDDFSQKSPLNPWLSLICDLRRFLLLNPLQSGALQEAFRSESLRIPVRDYSVLAKERGFIKRLLHFAEAYWFRRITRSLTIKGLVQQAKLLRGRYEAQFTELLEGVHGLSGYDRKRRIPKLRFHAGRLMYLSRDDSLLRLAPLVFQVEELHLHFQVMKAVATGEVDDLLHLGTNAAQAAAQPILAAGKNLIATKVIDTAEKQQSLAIFFFNGVRMKQPHVALPAESEILRFAISGSDEGLMRSADPYIREVACLHGLSHGPRHAETLQAVFDEDEELALDAIEQIQQSASD